MQYGSGGRSLRGVEGRSLRECSIGVGRRSLRECSMAVSELECSC